MLFHVYGENALPQWIAMLGVLAALILLMKLPDVQKPAVS